MVRELMIVPANREADDPPIGLFRCFDIEIQVRDDGSPILQGCRRGFDVETNGGHGVWAQQGRS
ncbi:MAG: hypothetical protein C7B46_19495 [Sulfobacillus benefaciens]|uniref:Uncharacterized protein n=1 Tax=Sulfobacillus benefaciens TaxID=453960 RepID=A0A2T2WYM2_9FIRM|nr:MAG: hypothetical protein C7B46_19495 [Sulfobacillus benefaciens]